MSPPIHPSKLIYQLMNFHKSWFDHHAIEYTIAERDRSFLIFRGNEKILTPRLRINFIITIFCSILLYKLLGVPEIPKSR
jgi:hypothetical protein